MRVYSKKFDAYYDPDTNKWEDDKCDDPKCEYCPGRPSKPLPEHATPSSVSSEITELMAASEALVKRWDSLAWKDGTHTGHYIDRLLVAVEKVRARQVEIRLA